MKFDPFPSTEVFYVQSKITLFYNHPLFKQLFSILKNGFGWIICNVGILTFILKFRFKLHSLEEETQSRTTRTTLKFIYILFGIITFMTTSVILSYSSNNLFVQHLHNLLNIAIVFICIPKYFINQNDNLKLYVSVYHHQPPPVLPWQLPSNFDPNSVKLITVQSQK